MLAQREKVNTSGIFVDSILMCLIKLLNYTAMLIAMTYNFWVVVVLAVGSGFVCMMLEMSRDRTFIKGNDMEH